MKLLITGANQPLGRAVARHFARGHTLKLTGCLEPSNGGNREDNRCADLCDRSVAEGLVRGMNAVVHLGEFDAPPPSSPQEEARALVRATQGTYALCSAARDAGVGRIVVVSRLSVFDTYPDQYLIDEQWRPRPRAQARDLAPYLCEQVVREFCREGPICGVGLRFRPIGDDEEANTSLADALEAMQKALALPLGPPGYRWHVFHVASSLRFLMRQADTLLQLGRQG